MQNFQITKNGYEVDIQIDIDAGHKFSFVKNSVIHEFTIKSFKSDYKSRGVLVEYSKTLKDANGSILNSQPLNYFENGNTRYLQLYNINSFTEPAGDFYGKQCINGVMERNIGFRAFNNDGTLIIED